jgi:FAD/FMN-containing dehydrogenase
MTGISRRAFLGSAVLTAAASVAGCGSAEREAIDRLRRGFDGRLLLGGEAGWLDLALASAQRYASTPRLIADCASESDVRRAYAFAREHDWPFAVRGGGHSYAGFSCTDGLLICTRGLDRVEVNPRLGTITVGAGALLGPLLESLRTSGAGLIIPVGMGSASPV